MNMTKFNETDEGRAFIASGGSRETSPEIMEAMEMFCALIAEAQALANESGETVKIYTDDGIVVDARIPE
jgi:hypothetical protein